MMLVTINQFHKQQNLMIIQWHRQEVCIVLNDYSDFWLCFPRPP